MSVSDDNLRERKLRELAAIAADAKGPGKHIDEPLLALMRDGDHGEDINDALAHVAHCASCRAELSEGLLGNRRMVVAAIEAPRGSFRNLERAAEGTNAKLVERGEGRWTAVVDASMATSLKDELEKPESSVIRRFEIGRPFDVPVEQKRARKSYAEIPESGMDVAEIQVWAEMSRKPAQRVGGFSLGWTAFGVIAIAGAVVIAVWLASHP